MSRDLGYLVDIGLAIQEALEFVEGITWEAFTTDRKTQAAVMHELTIIGEAARRVSAVQRIDDDIRVKNGNHAQRSHSERRFC